MKRYRLKDLSDTTNGHFLKDLVPGEHLCKGGLGFKKRGFRTHGEKNWRGSDRHVHDDSEVFVILQGKARMEVDGVEHPLVTGDVMVIEPGEDHHLISDAEDPCVNLWLHAGPKRHKDQR